METLGPVMRCDSLTLDSTYFTPEGYLVDTPILTRTGIFEYKNEDGSVRKELRLPEEVFAESSLKSYEGKPIILTHHAGRVDPDNVKREHIGTILSTGEPDGENVRAKIIIHDTSALQTGLRELSLGYDMDIDETPGEYNGEHYDAVQKNIKVNHLALVLVARAGDKARLNIDGDDEKEGESKMAKARKDSLTPEEMSNQVQAYEARKAERMANKPEGGEQTHDDDDVAAEIKSRRDCRDAQSFDSMDEAASFIAEQDEDIEKLLNALSALQAQRDFDAQNHDGGDGDPSDPEPDQKKEAGADGSRLDMADVDKYVKEKLMLSRMGDKLKMDGVDDMTPMEAKKAIIKKANPSIRLDGKDAAYIDALFDITKDNLTRRKDVSYQKQQMHLDGDEPQQRQISGADAARARMIERMEGKK